MPGCAGEPFAAAQVLRARDGATIELADGREVRLAGVVAPAILDGDAAAAERAAIALHALTAGRSVTLFGLAATPDRYARLRAQVAVDGNVAHWVQAVLVRAGVLRVAPGTGDPDCAAGLLREEREARANRAGLWGDRRFGVQEAGDTAALLAATGRFAVVEGTVERVGQGTASLFLDFGTRYREAFTVVIPRGARAAFAAAGVDPHSISGKRVRARGVIYSWGGPALELRTPAALELVEADGT
jgi:endonuclease YncB( thermonuclease family)